MSSPLKKDPVPSLAAGSHNDQAPPAADQVWPSRFGAGEACACGFHQGPAAADHFWPGHVCASEIGSRVTLVGSAATAPDKDVWQPGVCRRIAGHAVQSTQFWIDPGETG